MYRNNLKTKCLSVLIGSLFLVGGASAQTNTAEEITRINEEIAVLTAKLAKLDTEAKIAARQAEIRKLDGSSNITGNTVVPSGNDSDAPVVRSIEGIDGKLRATLFNRSGGGVLSVGEGDKYGAWTVRTIRFNSVTMARGKETISLNFGGESSGNQGGSAGLGGLPQGIGATSIPGR